jgi:GntR family transcriptional regulator
MIIIIDPSLSVPIYTQIMDQIMYRIASGELKTGDQLPSIRSLSVDLRINPNTVIKAYRELEHLGYASSHHGKGYFIGGKGIAPARDEWREKAIAELKNATDHSLGVGIKPDVIRAVLETILKQGGLK